jgi:DNA polymerase-3 subunit epsilon
VDYAGRIILKDGVPTISFGKYRDKSVKEIFQRDPAYFSWIENGEFTLDTKRQFRLLKEKYTAEQKAAKSKPLNEEQVASAAELLKNHFGSR